MNLEELYELEQKLVAITRDFDSLGYSVKYDKAATETEVYNNFWKLRESIQRLIAENH